MPRPAVYGLTILAFSAGFVLAGTLAFTYRATDAAESSPTVLQPCSTEMDRAYEITRFAQYSHIPWRDQALRDEITGPALACSSRPRVGP